MGFSKINAREFDVSGDIVNTSTTMDRGNEVATAPTVVYSGVMSKHFNPLKTDTSEVYEGLQEVSKQRNSWLIRDSSSRTITPNNMAYKIGSDYHHITGVRKAHGNRNLLFLDTILRDNQTT